MAFLSELDVINDMLLSLGEAPLNTMQDSHPYLPAGIRLIKQANWKEQAKAWWFNNEIITLNPDTAGEIFLPLDTIRIDPTNPSLEYVQRGRRLYRPYGSETTDKYKFNQPVQCKLVRLLPFDDLPALAQLLVSYSAQIEFQKGFDADPQKTADLRAAYLTTHRDLHAEHIRSQDANLLNRPSLAGIMNALRPRGTSTRSSLERLS